MKLITKIIIEIIVLINIPKTKNKISGGTIASPPNTNFAICIPIKVIKNKRKEIK